MTSNPRISPTQLIMMAVGSALMFPYTFMPILDTPPGNQDLWIVLIFSVVYVLIVSAPVLIIINKFRGLSINETAEMVLGKFFGKATALFLALFFTFCFSACMLIGATFVSVSIFPETPIWGFLIYTVIPVIYASTKGAGTIGRLSVFIVSFMILTIIVFFLLGLHQMDFKSLQPVLTDSSFFELNLGAFNTGTRYSEILLFFIFSYFLSQKASINKTYFKAVCIFFICFALMLIPVLLVLGIDFAKNEFNPYFIFTRQVSGYDFIQRVQALNALAWFPGLLLKLTLYNFMGSSILMGVFKTKTHKGFVIPIAVIGFAFCMAPAFNKTNFILQLTSDKVFPWIILPATFLLPLIILIVSLIRRKKINGMLEQKKSEANLSGSASCQTT